MNGVSQHLRAEDDRAFEQGKTQTVPYFCQWESVNLAHDFVTGRLNPVDDPLWQQFGASTREEYGIWSMNVCGMACLKMILAAQTGRIVPTVDLARQCTSYGAYTIDEAGIHGLIYAPFIRYLDEQWGIKARIEVNRLAEDIPSLLDEGRFFIASVHPFVRWPECEPPKKGGHLVLVTRANRYEIVFHNPSGHAPETQANASLSPEAFNRFFAGRGILFLD